ncbi:hypothetical protein phiK7A1_103 [Pseudomonas phage phiK7A1]|uniref:Uncharacterized protein n=1 Tax=Pseudomonas phage phiK7A1 TaxID=2759194 RepID=A0A7H0XFV1_9CAUD|nr:hypothetical protein phiK7A1_103 [Pseudomonas phage phiK7A1]
MNSPVIQAFLALRMSQRLAVAQRLNVCMSQGDHEAGDKYAIRILQAIEKNGLMRELESELREFE